MAGRELLMLELGIELGATLECGVELGALEEAGFVPAQALPLMTGRSAAPPFLFPWKPNDTDCPTAILPFQERLLAL